MNVELFLYLKKNLLGMFKVSHLLEEATGRHEQWTHLSGFFFLTFAVSIVSTH